MIFFRKIDGRWRRCSLWRGFICPVIREKAILLAGLLVAGSIAVGQTLAQDLQTEEQQNSVHGTVINAATHAPIARALIYSLDNRFAMMTDSEGRFEFSLPKKETEQEDTAAIASAYFSGSLGHVGLSLIHI